MLQLLVRSNNRKAERSRWLLLPAVRRLPRNCAGRCGRCVMRCRRSTGAAACRYHSRWDPEPIVAPFEGRRNTVALICCSYPCWWRHSMIIKLHKIQQQKLIKLSRLTTAADDCDRPQNKIGWCHLQGCSTQVRLLWTAIRKWVNCEEDVPHVSE